MHQFFPQVQSFGLNDREDVHQIEFLALLAFVARERQRLRTTTNPGTKFTRSDLEMAYAFKNQFISRPAARMPPTPLQRASMVDGGQQQPVVYRRTSLMERSPTDSAIDAINSPLPVDIPTIPIAARTAAQPTALRPSATESPRLWIAPAQLQTQPCWRIVCQSERL